ncbi:MAG TPA: translation initiation factor IF-2, partial [Candidatus Wallbacteria bacterium]|nr:translation initiation factor IF-2 [Candidatus Wallbacteria bacterium]
ALAEKLAETEKVDVKVYRIIYDAIDQIQQAMVGMYDPTYKEVVLGRAEVRQVFKISHIGTIGGCQVKDGKITRDATIRVVRDGIEIYEGKLKSLKRFKDDAKEVTNGLECGIGMDKFNDIKEGDILEAFEMQEVKPSEMSGQAQSKENRR